MKLTFVSNYINHHQIPLSNVLYEKLGDDYAFIQTEPMEEERIKMGWGGDFDNIPYLKKYYENGYDCKKIIITSDIVVFGGTENEAIIEDRSSDRTVPLRGDRRRLAGKPLNNMMNAAI